MPYFNHNGKQVWIPAAGESGREFLNKAGINVGHGRRAVIRDRFNAKTIRPNERITPRQLKDKHNRDLKIDVIPDRTKGGILDDALRFIKQVGDQLREHENNNHQNTNQQNRRVSNNRNPQPPFWGERTKLSRRIIIEQCEDVGKKMFKGDVQIDYEGAHTFVVNNFILPRIWKNVSGLVNNTTQLAIVFPTEYPKVAPIGFYMQATIGKSANGHFYETAYHKADTRMMDFGWKWYCVYIHEGAWQPSRYKKPDDWVYGDNLWTYMTLITEALSTRD